MKSLFAIIPFAVAAGCRVAFELIGSSVAPDGLLIEPFYLIPLGWLAFFVGVIATMTLAILSILRRRR